MKTKLFFLSAVFLLVMSGCGKEVASNNETKKEVSAPKVEINLTQEEVNSTDGNANLGAQLLVRKAVLKEMEANKYTPEEEKELNSAIENLKLEFFLNRTASKNVTVSDEEVLATYKENGEKLKDADIEVVFPQIKEKIFLYKVNNEKINYMNSLVEKYRLNDKIKEYYKPVEETQEVKVPESAKDEKKVEASKPTESTTKAKKEKKN